MRILAIETSCDETAVCLLESGDRFSDARIVTSLVASQEEIHAKTGGVVPEVAAREHVKGVITLLERAVPDANARIPDVISFTAGPGLLPALVVGAETAKALALAWDRPLVAVNHLEGHVWSGLLSADRANKAADDVKFPALALIASGGHTELVLARDFGSYEVLGETLDDAVGEAFDKVAKMLGLGYPGGPALSALAETGDPGAIDLPRPMMESGDFNFSFAGLKTAVLYKLRKEGDLTSARRADYAASFQQAAIDVLVAKAMRAARATGARTMLLGGGVSANREFRRRFKAESLALDPRPDVLVSPACYTGDNAAMIAFVALLKARQGRYTSLEEIKVDPRMTLGRREEG